MCYNFYKNNLELPRIRVITLLKGPQPRSSSHSHLRLPKERKSGIAYPTGLLPNWPASGSIFFNNVSLTYRQNSESANEQSVKALDDVSFTVKPGECVGIVGRTGSGKSSLIKVLLRLVDHLPGPYTNQYIANQTGFIGATGQVCYICLVFSSCSGQQYNNSLTTPFFAHPKWYFVILIYNH